MSKRPSMRAPIGPKAEIHENNFVAKNPDSESARRTFSCEWRVRCALRIASLSFNRCKKRAFIKGFLNFQRRAAIEAAARGDRAGNARSVFRVSAADVSCGVRQHFLKRDAVFLIALV